MQCKLLTFVTLPSEHTLCDYTHLIKSTTGIQPEVNSELVREAKVSSLQEWQKFIIVTFDGVKIKEDIVYDKNSGEIIGFVDLGQVNNQLTALADRIGSNIDCVLKPVADHMLLFMVRGVFTDLEFTYAQYATQTATGTEIFVITWDVKHNLECCDMKFIALSCDGASLNQKFFWLHKSSQKLH